MADGFSADTCFVPCSGGGLLAGVGIALRGRMPSCEIVAVEPKRFDDFGRSLRSGRLEANRAGSPTICDGLMAPSPGRLPLALAARFSPGAATVTDAPALSAMRLLFESLRIVAEPSGAVAVAAALAQAERLSGRCVVAVVSGGNVEPSLFVEALTGIRP